MADRGEQPDAIDERRSESARDLLLALDEDIRLPSITAADAGWVKFLSRHPGTRLQPDISTIQRKRCERGDSHIEVGELGDVATEALAEVDSDV